jgi:hypothetical protein
MKMASVACEQRFSLWVSDIFQLSLFGEILGIITRNAVDALAQGIPVAAILVSKQTKAVSKAPTRTDRYSLRCSESGFQSLLRTIRPWIGLPEGTVPDILLVDDFQTFSLTAEQFNSERWHGLLSAICKISENKFIVALYYSEKNCIESSFVSHILDMICDAIEDLTTRPSAVLPSPAIAPSTHHQQPPLTSYRAFTLLLSEETQDRQSARLFP